MAKTTRASLCSLSCGFGARLSMAQGDARFLQNWRTVSRSEEAYRHLCRIPFVLIYKTRIRFTSMRATKGITACVASLARGRPRSLRGRCEKEGSQEIDARGRSRGAAGRAD